MHYAPEAVVYHAHAMTLREFWQQHFNYGRGAFYFHRCRTQQRDALPAPEPLSFYKDLLRTPLRQHGPRGLVYAGLLLISQIANAAGYFYEAGGTRP